MSDTSRRKFLAATGAGAAAGTVALTTGSASAAQSTTLRSGASRLPVVAVIEDHFSDKLSLRVGEREVVVHDRALVVRLLNAAGGN